MVESDRLVPKASQLIEGTGVGEADPVPYSPPPIHRPQGKSDSSQFSHTIRYRTLELGERPWLLHGKIRHCEQYTVKLTISAIVQGGSNL